MSDLDLLFMQAARSAAELSDDRSRKVGCIIVGSDDVIRVRGSNRFPDGVQQNDERHQRPEKYFWIEHAERNAIYYAARMGISLRGCRAYLPWFPCMDCARALAAAGIVELVAVEPDLTDPKWGDDFKRVGTLLREAGVAVRFVELA